MYSYKILVDAINEHDDKNELFWVASIAKDCWPILKDHLEELHEAARIAVEHYMEESEEKESEMFVRCNSHRAREKLLRLFPGAIAYYYSPKLFKDKSKGYYLIPVGVVPDITGISKPRDQNSKNYGQCWSGRE